MMLCFQALMEERQELFQLLIIASPHLASRIKVRVLMKYMAMIKKRLSESLTNPSLCPIPVFPTGGMGCIKNLISGGGGGGGYFGGGGG
jgi:hypothetical protein